MLETYNINFFFVLLLREILLFDIICNELDIQYSHFLLPY